MASSRSDRRGRVVIRRSAGPVSVGLAIAGLLGGCGSSRQALTMLPLPVVVSPASPDWEVSVGIEVKDGIMVRVENHSGEPVSVLWDESSYIDVDQGSHAVAQTAVASIVKRPRAVLPPETRLEELLAPEPGRAGIPLDPLLSAGERGHWWWPFGKQQPLRVGSKVRLDHPALGREIGVFLVLERAGVKKTVLVKYKLAGGAPAY